MARGKSGRIVLEIEPLQKAELYRILALEDLTLKQWFLERVKRYIENSKQPSLFSDQRELLRKTTGHK